MSPFCTLTPFYLRSHLILTFCLPLRLPNCPFPSDFATVICYTVLRCQAYYFPRPSRSPCSDLCNCISWISSRKKLFSFMCCCALLFSWCGQQFSVALFTSVSPSSPSQLQYLGTAVASCIREVTAYSRSENTAQYNRHSLKVLFSSVTCCKLGHNCFLPSHL